MFLSKILVHLCMTIHYIMEENIFVIIVYKFISEEIFKCHIKDCFKIIGKQRIRMPKKSEYVKLKTFERKIKSPFMIYADFESILGPEDNGKQNPEETCKNKYQNHAALSYGY